MTRSEKQQIRRYVEDQYAHVNGRNIRCHADGSVWVYVDKMPRTNEPGRIFAGWDTWLLRDFLAGTGTTQTKEGEER